MGCISPRGVKRRRSTDPTKPPKPQWTYTVAGTVVCKHTFLSLHGITDAKLREIMKQRKTSQENINIAHPDMRGKSECINYYV